MTGRPDPDRDRGSVAVEMAVFVVPVMMLLVAFIVFCGRAASAAIDVNAAGAAGARAAAAADTPAAAVAAARAAVTAGTTTTRACTPTVDTGAFRPGGQVTVRLECPVRLADLGLPGISAVRVLHATATEPIDAHRAMP